MELEQFGFKKKFFTENKSYSTDNVSASPDEEKTESQTNPDSDPMPLPSGSDSVSDKGSCIRAFDESSDKVNDDNAVDSSTRKSMNVSDSGSDQCDSEYKSKQMIFGSLAPIDGRLCNSKKYEIMLLFHTNFPKWSFSR